MKAIWNGELVEQADVKVSGLDRGYLFGDGVYEVVRVYQGRMFMADEHAERWARSVAEARIPVRVAWLGAGFVGLLRGLVAACALVDGYVYVHVTRGEAPRAHHFPTKCEPVMYGYAVAAERPLQAMAEGIKAVVLADERWLRCDIKSLNLLPNVLAKQTAMDQGAADAILQRGEVITEGSASNVFIVRDGALWTHPVSHFILQGITRIAVLRMAAEAGIAVHEQEFDRETLMAADEVFLTSTNIEVMPVVAMDGQRIGNGVPGAVTRKLQELYAAAIEACLAG